MRGEGRKREEQQARNRNERIMIILDSERGRENREKKKGQMSEQP